MSWVIIIAVLLIIALILDREIYFYEGAHLGPRVQSWLYDRWSGKYDSGKRESQLHDDEMLAGPLLEKLANVSEPFILDFATGTGRLALALLSRPEFQGRIIAVDLSRGMLEQATAKIDSQAERDSNAHESRGRSAHSVEFLRHRSMPLPFPDAVFDAVACLEVLELLPDAQAALDEMSRLLRPGGILLASRGTEESGRRAKVKSEAELTVMLQSSGFERIQITKWWKLFDRVLARKTGTSASSAAKSLTDVLKCSKCDQVAWIQAGEVLRCSSCGHQIHITKPGIYLN